jgi:hypothetical protein
MFRSATEKASLNLVVDCSPIEREVYVDREMWGEDRLQSALERFQVTFEGEINVALRESGRACRTRSE